MPVNVIGTLKPKNNGKFPVAEAVDIKVTDDLRLDEALENKADLSTVNFALNNKADKTTTTSLQNQINNIIEPVTEEAEVINARVGTDGTSYNTLKARLDAEETQTNEFLNISNPTITPVFSDYTGKFISSAGVIGTNALFSLSDFIRITSSYKQILITNRAKNTIINAVSFFSSNELSTDYYISGVVCEETGDMVVDIPANATYFTIASNTDENGTTHNNVSYAFSFTTVNERLAPIKADIQSQGAEITNAHIGVDSTSYVSLKARLDAEKNDTDSIINANQGNITPVYSDYTGKFIGASGVIANNASYSLSDFIPVTFSEKQVVMKNRVGNAYANAVSFFTTNILDEAYYISGAVCETTGNLNVTIPANAKYMTIMSNTNASGSTASGDSYSFSVASVNERLTKVSNNLESEIIESKKVTNGYVAEGTGENLTLTVPDVKFTTEIEYYSMITTLDKIQIGKGTTEHGDWYAEIDDTNIKIYAYKPSLITILSEAHGLTISDYIQVLIHYNYDGTAQIVINTVSGSYVHTVNELPTGRATVYAKSSGTTALTYNRLSWYAPALDKKIWIFGDSYLDFYCPTLRTWGYTNAMFSGYGGCMSWRGARSLKDAIKLKKPEIIVWALGMNDGDGDSAINANWQTYAEQVMNICDENGVKLIFFTIPNTPSINNQFKNTYIRNSDYDYIDIAYSVTGNTSGNTWYNGLIAQDNVHPSTLGSQTIAAYIVNHMPQLRNSD